MDRKQNEDVLTTEHLQRISHLKQLSSVPCEGEKKSAPSEKQMLLDFPPGLDLSLNSSDYYVSQQL